MAGNEINLTLKITEKGNLKVVGQNAERAAAGLDKAGKSARTADRNIKGAAQTSANGSKNFSKMAQGISGGLVPAYATLAAQIFAVSAAFNFLKDAGQLGLLQSGQTAYAAATGISLKSLTEDIQAATESQLGFRDAAQAAAIGTAAGLDPTQITQVAKAAKDASTVLGRDLTDSFNRLTRGITKAAPELLDELGIILRLDTATQNYADALGRSKDSLSAFERSQAVANEVLTQAEEKYGKVLAVTGGGANEFAKLSTAFEDIVNNLRKFAVDFLTPIATTLQEMPGLIFAAFAPFGAQVLKTALPGLEKVSGALDNMATRAESASEKAQKSLKESLKDDELVKSSAVLQQALQKEVQANAQVRLADVQANKNSLLQKLKDGKQLSNAQIVQVRKNLQAEARGYKIKDKEIKASLHRTLNEMERSNNLTTKKMELHFKTLSFSVQKSFTNIKTSAAGLFASLVRGAQAAGAGISMALSAISWIGLIASLGALAISFFRSGKEAEDAGSKYNYLQSKVETLTAETEEFIAVQNILNDTFDHGNKAVEAYGKRLSNTSTQKLGDTLKGSKELIAIQKEITGVIEQAQKDLPRAARASEASQRTSQSIIASGSGASPVAFLFAQREEKKLLEEVTEVRKKATMGLQEYIEGKKEELTPAENALKILLDDKKALEGLTNERFHASTVVNSYKASLDALAKGQEVDIELLLKQRTAVEKLASEISELTRLQSENSRAISTAEARVLPLSEYDQLLTNMNQELRLLQDIAFQYEKTSEGRQLTEIEEKRLKFLKDRKSLIESLANLEFKIAKNTLATDTALITASRGKTKLVKDAIRLEADIVKSKIKEFELSEKIRQATKLMGEDATAIKEAQAARDRGETLTREQETLLSTNVARERSIELAAAELGLTKEKTAELELQKNTLFQLQQAALQAFETSVQSNLASLIKGDESSLKDAMLSIAQSTLSAVADTLAQQMTQGLMESLFGIMSPEERIKQKMLEAAEEHGRIVQAAVKGESITPLGEIQKTAMGNESSTTPEKKSIMEKLFGAPSQREVPQEGADVKIVGNRGGSVNRFLGDFAAIFDKNAGEGGLVEKLGNVFASGGDIFKDIFSSLPDLLGGLFGGAGGGGGLLKLFGFANGGIAKGGFRTAAYATGGIAKSPTVGLVGEGKYNEAIVPLPDGKSIPVMMGKGAGQQNNVVVNVSIDGNGNTNQSTEGDQQGMDLGKVIASAVQQELLNQKRQGGILNPNGVA